MEHRIFVFKIGLATCGLAALVLALPAMAGHVMAAPHLGGLTLAFIGIAAMLMGFALKFDSLGIRALVIMAVSVGVFATEVLFAFGRRV